MNLRSLLSVLAFSILPAFVFAKTGPFLGTGVKVGEVDQSSAIVWARLTAEETARFDMLPIFTEGLLENVKDKDVARMPSDVAPGMAGEVRVRFWRKGESHIKGEVTSWEKVAAGTNFTHQFSICSLDPNTRYSYIVEARAEGSQERSAALTGGFHTAPLASEEEAIRFIVTTCQAVRSIDSGAAGHRAYEQMLSFHPHFFVHTGDIVYYDKAPLAMNVAEARAKWDLMFSYGHNQNFHRWVSSYFMKDDHDTLKNDCWPGQTYGDLTFEEGLDLFKEEVPMGEKTYRTIRWGKDVQVWMTENRDYRSSNKMEDGPEKTILGAEQKAWLKRTIRESDATYKFIITPGPIVGPDKKGKKDNHANDVFAHEGQELRDFIQKQDKLFVICGDRHWQYCSKDPKTGVIEMGCGPINDQHSFGGDPGNNEEFHRYFSDKGGFLGITIDGETAKAEWFNTNQIDAATGKPAVLYTENLSQL